MVESEGRVRVRSGRMKSSVISSAPCVFPVFYGLILSCYHSSFLPSFRVPPGNIERRGGGL